MYVYHTLFVGMLLDGAIELGKVHHILQLFHWGQGVIRI